MGKLWEIVQRHIDQQPYGVSQRQLAGKLGMSPTALGNWRELKALPTPANLHALANLTGTPYLRVLDAALEDAGYIPKAGDERGYTPPMNEARVTELFPPDVPQDPPTRAAARKRPKPLTE